MKQKPATKTNPAVVTRVVDGDTLEMTVDVGWKVAVTATIRLAGIDCPERNTKQGIAAKAFAIDWIANHGSIVTLTSHPTKDRYGRHLGDVISDNGQSLSEDLIAAGHGKPWDGRGQRPQQDS